MSNKINIREIENSIIKKYRKKLWAPFIKGINEYDMIADGDKIAICVSGGKDSLLLAKLFQELQKHGKFKFDLVFIAMNPGFDDYNTELLENTCKELEIDLQIFDTEIFAIVEKIAQDYPCYMCARMRRGALYEYAAKLGCNKIALGHHYDDFIETTMLNILFAGKTSSMMPKLKAKNHENMELIRPLIYVREKDIIEYTTQHNIKAMKCGCSVASGATSTKRTYVKRLIEEMVKENKDIEKSIFASSKNVSLGSIIGGKNIDDTKFSFLDKY